MVNWHDPGLIIQNYFTLTKLLHTIGSAYIWETIFSAGFELNVLRGKQPYKWTIWLYLGTRYSCLLMFIVYFILNNSSHVPCQPFVIANYTLPIVSWGFATLIIVLRVIAIWDRNVVVSSIALSMWLAGLGLNIRTIIIIEPMYDSILETCLTLKSHSGLAGAASVLAADTTLLVIMLIGLLRHAHRSSTGIWHLLYKQCIIWMILAPIAEIPPVVFLILDLNDPWNQMFSSAAITILSICAARMYRSLSKYGSLTEYSSDSPQFSGGLPASNYQRGEAHGVYSTIQFRTVTQADRILAEPFEFIPAEQIQLEFAPGTSNTTLAEPAKTKSGDTPGYQTSWLRPG